MRHFKEVILIVSFALAACGYDGAPAEAALFEQELCERNRSAFPDDSRTPSLTRRKHVCEEGGSYRWEWLPDAMADHGGYFTPVEVCDPGNVECADYWCTRPCKSLGLD